MSIAHRSKGYKNPPPYRERYDPRDSETCMVQDKINTLPSPLKVHFICYFCYTNILKKPMLRGTGNIVEPSTIHCRNSKAWQRLRAEGVADPLFRPSFGFASNAPSPGSRWNTSGAGQRLMAVVFTDLLLCLAFGFTFDAPSLGSRQNTSRARQRLRAEGVANTLSRSAFGFASYALSLGSRWNTS